MSVRFVIDSLDFVRKAGKHHGRIPLAELTRVQDFLFENKGEVFYWIKGEFDQNGRPHLHVQVMGDMLLCCQRCLGGLRHTLSIDTSLLLVETEDELIQADADNSVDAILATADMDVVDLIEEEIILSLSISSRHREGECEVHKPERYKARERADSENPFTALKAFKKNQH